MLLRLMISFPLLFLSTFFFSCAVQKASPSPHYQEILAWQQELDAEYANADTSPLEADDLAVFEGLDFFSVDSTFRVVAKFIRIDTTKSVSMETTKVEIRKVFDEYAVVEFEYAGHTHQLTVYQSHRLRETEEYANYLFLPFRDPTNGLTTYGGGRYMDLRIPEGDTIVLDFNKAYNPYCAYTSKYSCPLVPPTNRLSVKVQAGVRAYEK